jgi:hypothetical protein
MTECFVDTYESENEAESDTASEYELEDETEVEPSSESEYKPNSESELEDETFSSPNSPRPTFCPQQDCVNPEHHNTQWSKKEFDCPICFESFKNDEIIHTACCDNKIHLNCLQKSLEHSVHRECPFCLESPFDPTPFHKKFSEKKGPVIVID